MTRADLDDYERGWKREAYAVLEEGGPESDVSWLKAELWRDARWVTLLATTYHSRHGVTVPQPARASSPALRSIPKSVTH